MFDSSLSDTATKLLAYNKNYTGPRIEPCGTPQTTVLWEDLLFCNDTNCLQTLRYDVTYKHCLIYHNSAVSLTEWND